MAISKLNSNASLRQVMDKFEEISLSDFPNIDIVAKSKLPSQVKNGQIVCVSNNVNGKIYFDLGVAPRLEKWIYTFKEVTPPAGYNPIIDTTMEVTYDNYGRMTIGSATSSRINPMLEHSSDPNCRSMIAVIYKKLK